MQTGAEDASSHRSADASSLPDDSMTNATSSSSNFSLPSASFANDENPSSSLITIHVKSLEPSSTYTLSVPLDASVTQLKERIRHEFDVDISRQRLIFQGRVLKNDKLLHEYGLSDNKTIHLVIRPLGAQPNSTNDEPQSVQRLPFIQLPHTIRPIHPPLGANTNGNVMTGTITIDVVADRNTRDIVQNLLNTIGATNNIDNLRVYSGAGVQATNLHNLRRTISGLQAGPSTTTPAFSDIDIRLTRAIRLINSIRNLIETPITQEIHDYNLSPPTEQERSSTRALGATESERTARILTEFATITEKTSVYIRNLSTDFLNEQDISNNSQRALLEDRMHRGARLLNRMGHLANVLSPVMQRARIGSTSLGNASVQGTLNQSRGDSILDLARGIIGNTGSGRQIPPANPNTSSNTGMNTNGAAIGQPLIQIFDVQIGSDGRNAPGLSNGPQLPASFPWSNRIPMNFPRSTTSQMANDDNTRATPLQQNQQPNSAQSQVSASSSLPTASSPTGSFSLPDLNTESARAAEAHLFEDNSTSYTIRLPQLSGQTNVNTVSNGASQDRQLLGQGTAPQGLQNTATVSSTQSRLMNQQNLPPNNIPAIFGQLMNTFVGSNGANVNQQILNSTSTTQNSRAIPQPPSAQLLSSRSSSTELNQNSSSSITTTQSHTLQPLGGGFVLVDIDMSGITPVMNTPGEPLASWASLLERNRAITRSTPEENANMVPEVHPSLNDHVASTESMGIADSNVSQSGPSRAGAINAEQQIGNSETGTLQQMSMEIEPEECNFTSDHHRRRNIFPNGESESDQVRKRRKLDESASTAVPISRERLRKCLETAMIDSGITNRVINRVLDSSADDGAGLVDRFWEAIARDSSHDDSINSLKRDKGKEKARDL